LKSEPSKFVEKPNKIRLAWIATHPVQYQVPLLREIAKEPYIDLEVIYFSDFSIRGYVDQKFGRKVTWDINLLDGYQHFFLGGLFNKKITDVKLFSPLPIGLKKKFLEEKYDVVLVQGWNNIGMVYATHLAKKIGAKVLMRCEATDHVDGSRGFKRTLREKVVKYLLDRTDLFMSIGHHNTNFYKKRGVPDEKIKMMPYCVDNDFFIKNSKDADLKALRTELNLKEGVPVILFASKFTKRKFPDLLLEAYSKLSCPRPYLLFVGDGELKENLLKKADENDLNLTVRFAGFRNQSELPGFYQLADIFVLPSINETWGLVVNEAMCAGCAIIATDQVGSAADLVEDGVNGFVVEARNILELRKALKECVENYCNFSVKSTELINQWGIKENLRGLNESIEYFGMKEAKV
jgi:glycosyltransferase involved in cell wall biosynthesis